MPIWPVAQKPQAAAQPTCDDTQSDTRPVPVRMMTDSIKQPGRGSQHELRRAVDFRIERLLDRERMKLDAAGELVAHVVRQLRQRRLDAEKLLEKCGPQRAQPPRLELQLRPQPIDRGRIVDADL